MTQSKPSLWKTTHNFLLIFASANTRLIANTRQTLEGVQGKTTYKLTAIHQTEIKTIKKLRKALIKDSNRLRRDGYPELALKVVKAAQSMGISSPELEAERAISLTALNEHEKAIQIWKEQSLSDKPKVRDQANNAIKIHAQNLNLASELLQALRASLNTEAILSKHLPETAPPDLTRLEHPIVNEAIALRKDKNNELSLKLLNITTKAGLNSDAINDNKARALFNIGQKRDAVHIWQSLLSSKNEETKISAEKVLNELSNNLLASVRSKIKNNYLPIRYLPDKPPQDLTKLGTCILKEAIELRKEKQEGLSLQILEIAASAGFETDSINENRARALINAKRNVDAIYLLKELLSSKNEEIQKTSYRILVRQGANLIEKINKTLTLANYKIHYCLKEVQEPIQELENLILKEAIGLRKDKEYSLSLRILDFAVEYGLHTERIDDNRARVLVNMKLYSEAVSIWESLTTSTNANIRESTNTMLKRFRAQAMQQKTLEEVDNILSCEGDPKKAINILTNAVLKYPTDQKLLKKLGEITLMNGVKENYNDQKFEELLEFRQSLAGFEAFITALELQHMPMLQGKEEEKKTLQN